MRIVLFLYLIFIPMNQVWSQSLDYARDVFFYDSPLVKAKNYYYQYTPLLFIVSNYAGKGLHVVIACPEGTSLLIAKKNIELEIDFNLDRHYLSRLEIIHDEKLLHQYLEANEVDVIILEETLIENNLDLFQKYKNQIMIFNSNSKKSTKPKKSGLVPLAWQFQYNMNSISTELIKVWHLKEKYRSYLLFVERTRNFTITFYKRIWFLLFLLLISLLIIYGYYRRIEKRNYKNLYVICVSLFVFLLSAFTYSKLSVYQNYLQKAFFVRNNPKISTLDVIKRIDDAEVLTKVASLRTLTERFIDAPNEISFVTHKELITEKILTSLQNEDERVRMWCLAFIANFNDKNLVNFIASKSWDKENSYLVRTRVVRVLASLENAETNQALLQLAKIEKQPYVYYEVRKVCISRGIWSQEENRESIP